MNRLLALLLLCAPVAVMAEPPTRRLNDAADVLSEVMSAPDKGIPTDLLARAHCIVIVPGLKSGAFGIGAKYGKGFFSCRRGAGWSAPASVRIEGGTVGFQIGLIETDLVMLVMNAKGAHRLLTDQFTLGGEGEVAAGPVGRSTTAQTDVSLRAEMLAWSRARGVFAGVSLQGATLRQDVDDNAEIYGRPFRNKEIIYGPVAWPPDASEFHSVLNRYAARARRLKHRT
ncbi:MAG: lipid-binding SYLF domain-containing protein [Acidobacteriaceae bacterium]|nr:lipid-binding SYLF domain-containing protein [Acidobacteriaceae bacterium]